MKSVITSIFILLILFAAPTYGKKHKKGSAFEISYASYRNGSEVPGRGMSVKYANQIAYLSNNGDKIRSYIDYAKNKTVTILNYEDELFKTLTSFDSLPQPKAGGKTETILGYDCQYAKLSSFSNTIEIWYSDQTGAKGSPYQGYLPDNSSLVLKVTINGNRTLVAKAIDKLHADSIPDYPLDEATEVTASELEELKIKSRYTVLPVFKDEIINFENLPETYEGQTLESNRTYRFSKGSVIMKKVTLPESWKSGGQVFAKLTSWSNGDAYDRTGSIFVLPASHEKKTILAALKNGLDELPVLTDNKGAEYQGIASTKTYDSPIEIMRFFTSFGVGHFNNLRVINNYPWEFEATYKQEVTPLIPNDDEEVWVGVFIGNYDKGGHKVNLELDFYPGFDKEEQATKYIQPLFYTVNIMEMSGQNYGRLFRNDTLTVEFEVPENVENLQLQYTSTGHGGWGGGDEFNPKLNQIFIDGEPTYKVVPWRTDCATYRFSNPASGNFGNGLSSSDLSRSNWCPATLTPPDMIPLTNFTPGKHTLKVVIDQGADEGNSFSHWSVAGVLTGNYKEASK
ncbi:PNGase F N-terminal domain-containing protein [Sunxiuqinia sp. sy24]|uniref:PNGase F N-terminal domain-containing protein n=1 Tax=Sunxiuqinia sp. sy24 TaxID=3461495 RepID=UPI0040466F07